MHVFRIYFFRLLSGREPVREFLRSLSKPDRAKAGAHLHDLELQGTLAASKAKHLGKGLWEVRFIGEQGKIRIFYCLLRADWIALLHAILKKGQKTPKKDLDLAYARKRLLEEDYDD